MSKIITAEFKCETAKLVLDQNYTYQEAHSQSKRNKTVGHYAACKCVKNTSFGER